MTSVELILLGTLTLTSYQPIPAQTKPECKNRHQCETSIGDGITMYGVAASQDLLKSGRLHYGDAILVPGFGKRIVNDAMGETKCVLWSDHKCIKRVPIVNSIDLLVFTRREEKVVGVRRVNVYRIDVEEPK